MLLCPSNFLPAGCSGANFWVGVHPSWPVGIFLALLTPTWPMVKSSNAGPVRQKHVTDSDGDCAGPSRARPESPDAQGAFSELEDNGSENEAQGGSTRGDVRSEEGNEEHEGGFDGLGDGMNLEGFSGPEEKVVKPLTPEALAAFTAAKEKTGVIYISRIPPGMRPTKVRHLMSQYGEVGKVYLQQEGERAITSFPIVLRFIWRIRFSDAKRAYLRRKFTSTKKPHFTEGWVEFKDKKIARSVADMLNATSIGGKKGTRFRDDVWTMKYLPKFKWDMLTEQIGRPFSFFDDTCH